jgi:NADPH:quinone reductase-like Zn-dependent oxidoreductase
MATMKAVRIFEFGGPEKLIYGDYPMPEVGPNDVLVKVMATRVSRFDVKYRLGEIHQWGRSMSQHGGLIGRKAFPMPMQLGRDVSGEVAAVGEAVTSFRPGDRVVGLVHPEDPNSLETIRGLGNLCSGIDLPGHTMFGGYAQYVSRAHSYWLPIADSVAHENIASAMWACSTSYHIVNARLGVKPNDFVLVTGASGGMGTATMQIARLAGATVIATTRSIEKAQRLLANGADHVLDIGAGDIEDQIRRVTRGQGVDCAAEFTGAIETLRLCVNVMRLGGTFCPVAGELLDLPIRVSDLVSKELNVHGVRASTRNDQRIVTELVEKGRLRVPIHAVLPLSEIAAAHTLLDSGEIVGRIVLHPWDD